MQRDPVRRAPRRVDGVVHPVVPGLGAQVPASWSLDFAIPLMFVILLVPTIKGRPELVAAVIGATVAVVTAGAPYGLGLMIGAVSGVVAGIAANRVER